MTASPVLVSSNPQLLTGRQSVYTAKDFRKPMTDILGPGVYDQDSFRVRQRAAGANMSVDIMTASVYNRAYVKGTTSTDQGLYRADFNSATQLNVDVPTADATNPRFDSVYLVIEDSQEVGGNDRATIVYVPGTPNALATIDNNAGAGAAPASSLLLANIIVAVGTVTVPNSIIRDRRVLATRGLIPQMLPGTTSDVVSFEPAAGLVVSNTALICSAGVLDAMASFALMYLPHRIVGATKLRFRHLQGATANVAAANQVLGIYDAAGKLMSFTTLGAWAGTANQIVENSLTLTNQSPYIGTYEVGYYYVYMGVGAATASSSVIAHSGVVAAAQCRGLWYYLTTGATGIPTYMNIAGSPPIDLASITGAAFVNRPAVPMCALSVA